MKAKLLAMDRKRMIHLACALAIALVALLLFYKHFLSRGMLMHVDMTFPTTIDRNMMLYNHSWWQYGSVQNIWNLQRVFWAYPLLGLVKLLHIPTDVYLFILFWGTFALAGISMYFLAYDTIRRFKGGDISIYAAAGGALFAGIIYIYNPFSVSHLWPYFGYPGYALLPLAFLLLVKAVEAPKAWKIVLLAVVISVAGTGPINSIWFWFMIVAYLIFFLASRRFNRESLGAGAKVLFPLAGLYLLLNALWMYPYVASRLISKPITPVYMGQFSRSMLDLLSKNGTILNNIRFTTGWGMPVDPAPSGAFWVIVSFALPVLAVVAFAVLRKKALKDKTVLFWTIMFGISVLLATGTSTFLAKPYSWFVMKAPGISSLGWVFRAADRWLIFAAVFYSLLLGLLVAWLFRDGNAWKQTLAACAIGIILISFLPITISYAKNVYNPTQIPKDYDQVTSDLAKLSKDNRPIWLPFARDGFRFAWAPEKRIGPFDVYTSNPSLNNLQDIFGENNYYYWLENLLSTDKLGPADALNKSVMLSDDLAAKLFLPLAGEFLILDSSVPDYSAAGAIAEDRSLKSIIERGELEVFQPSAQVEPIRAATTTVLSDSFYDQLALSQKLGAEQMEKMSFASPEDDVGPPLGGISMDKYMEPFDVNSGFERVGPDGMPQGWASQVAVEGTPGDSPRPAAPSEDVRVTVDTSTKVSGKQSLKVENSATRSLNIHSVSGGAVPVVAGEVYKIKSWVRYRNTEWTRVAVDGFVQETGEWVTLVNCPVIQSGNSGWKNFECSFHMPKGITLIRPVAVAGWSRSFGRPAVSWFDDIELFRLGDGFYQELAGAPAQPKVEWKRLSPEKYEVKVTGARKGFVLAFAQAYDPLWVARVETEKARDPIRLYSTINGFEVYRDGDFKITLEYQAQGWFLQGFVVSFLALLLSLGYLGYFVIRTRRARIVDTSAESADDPPEDESEER